MHCLTVTNSVGPISDPARLGSTNGIKGGLTISIPAAARHTLLYVDDELIPCIAYVANMYSDVCARDDAEAQHLLLPLQMHSQPSRSWTKCERG